MAIEDHNISGQITDVTVDLIPITEDEYHDEHYISGAITDLSCKLCPAIWPQVQTIANPDASDTVTILITCDLPLYGTLTGLQSAFIVRDNINTNFTVSATQKGLTDNIIVLTVANFESASGDLTVTYTHLTAPIYAQVEGGCFMQLDDFAIAFTPDLTPPEAYTAHNISGQITDVVVDLKLVTYTNGIHDHSISGTITDVTVTLIHIDDINP